MYGTVPKTVFSSSLERLPVDILHDQVVRPDVVELTDIGVIERGNYAGFPLEALGGNLYRDITAEPCIASPVHFAHPACADGGQGFVRSEVRARRETHGKILSIPDTFSFRLASSPDGRPQSSPRALYAPRASVRLSRWL